jgi:hypothetical protein
MKIKVKDNTGLERDVSSNAIINVDGSAYAAVLAKRKAMAEAQSKMNGLEEEVAFLKESQRQLQETVNKLISLLDK